MRMHNLNNLYLNYLALRFLQRDTLLELSESENSLLSLEVCQRIDRELHEVRLLIWKEFQKDA
jgi:hypothetical protein